MARLLLLGLVLLGSANANANPPPHIELTATPAWKGWTRPGRATEIDVRLMADTATRVTLVLAAGHRSVHAEVDLLPGRTVRLHIPVGSAAAVAVSAASPAQPPMRRDIAIAQSESPLLGVGLMSGETMSLAGFHTVALGADDLPRGASAYASVDALILDAPTLGALDQRQLGALLAHAAGCGRIVVLNTDPRVHHLLEGAAGCGGRALIRVASLTDAKQRLESSLRSSLPAAMEPGSIEDSAQPSQLIWNRVAVALAVYFAAALLAFLSFAALPVVLLMPALAALATWGLLHTTQSDSQVLVWSEGESGANLARYQAWQRIPGLVRERMRVPIPPQLASDVRPCETSQAIRLDFDANAGRMSFAEFDTRLFSQVLLCYSGNFPMARALSIQARADGVSEVRNVGATAWPQGLLLTAGLAHELPALAPGAATAFRAGTGIAPRNAVVRAAMTRTPPDGFAALWPLELGGVAEIPGGSRGWLFVPTAAP